MLVTAATDDPPNTLAANGHAESASELAKVLSVEDKTFFVVKATAESLTLLSEYAAVVVNLEIVVTDVMSRIIEFLKVCSTYWRPFFG